MNFRVMLKNDYDLLLQKMDAIAPGWFVVYEENGIKYVNSKKIYNCMIDKVVNKSGYSARVKQYINNDIKSYYDLLEIKRIYESIKSTEDLGVWFDCKEDFEIWCSNMLVWGEEYIEVSDEQEQRLMKISFFVDKSYRVQNRNIHKNDMLDFMLAGLFIHLNYELNRVYQVATMNCNFVEATEENLVSISKELL